MKKQFILFVVGILTASPICLAQASPSKAGKSAAKETEIINLEKSAWEAYKSKQADAYKSFWPLIIAAFMPRELRPWIGKLRTWRRRISVTIRSPIPK